VAGGNGVLLRRRTNQNKFQKHYPPDSETFFIYGTVILLSFREESLMLEL
jgi:hypothetical protein